MWNMEINAVTWQNDGGVSRHASLISCDIHLAVASGHHYNILFFLPSSHSPQISQLPLVINRWQQTARKSLMGSSSSLSTAAWSIPVNAWQPCNVHLFVFQYAAGMWECDKNGTAVFWWVVCINLWKHEDESLGVWFTKKNKCFFAALEVNGYDA